MAKTKRVKVVMKPTKNKKKQQKIRSVQQEVGLLGQALRSLGGVAGGAVGSMFGAPIMGSSAGTGLGAAISKWLGSGDYSVSMNSMVSSMKASGSIPAMHTSDQTVVVRHKEFICEVLSNTAFSVNRSFKINPGDAVTFPWLSRIANSYQQYRFKGVVYHYVPTSGTAVGGTSSALGSVILQTSYRASDTPPTTKVEMLNEYWSTESVPSETFAHPIECNPAENPFNVLYVKGADVPVPAGDSSLLYDLGTTHLATSGQQVAGTVLGDLWVTYEVELKKPILASNTTSHTFLYTSYANQNAPTTGNPFGSGTSTIGNIPAAFSARTITLPAYSYGEFFIVVRYVGAGLSGLVATGTSVVTNCALVPWSVNFANYGDSSTTGITGATYACRVSKFQRELAATIQIPLTSATAGSYSLVEVTLFGVPTDLA